MNDNTRELKSQLRDAQGEAKAGEAALKKAKNRTVKLAVWSAIGGFMLFAVGGQWFPGYQLDSTAKDTAQEAAVVAVRNVMAQLCAERFMVKAGLETRLADLNAEVGDWSQANFIRAGMWAATPDGEKTDHATAEKCRGLIAERVTAESGKTS